VWQSYFARVPGPGACRGWWDVGDGSGTAATVCTTFSMPQTRVPAQLSSASRRLRLREKISIYAFFSMRLKLQSKNNNMIHVLYKKYKYRKLMPQYSSLKFLNTIRKRIFTRFDFDYCRKKRGKTFINNCKFASFLQK
jgi:hypothetical protein